MNRSAPISALKRVLHVLDELGKDSFASCEHESPLHRGVNRCLSAVRTDRLMVDSRFR